jgi:hypothetical protein
VNVLPKKRAQQVAQYLTLSRNLSLSRNIPVLQNLSMWKRQITSHSMNWMRLIAKKMSSQSRVEKTIPHRAIGALRLDDFSITLFTKMMNRRFVWFSASLAMYGWFLLQIANDIFILHKDVTKVSLTSYAGAITAIVLIWCGTIVLKAQPVAVLHPIGKMLKNFRKKKEQSNTDRTTSMAVHLKHFSAAQIIPVTVMPSKPPAKNKTPQRKSLTGLKCQTHMTSSLDIPDSCLTCKELIVCLSKLD